MNKAILVGRLTKDPEIKTGSTTSARFTVAVQRNFKDKDGRYGADFINCVAFGKTAEFVEKFFHKGNPIGVSGRINTGSYTNKDGQTVYTTDIMVDNAEFVTGKSEGGNAAPAAISAKPQTPVDEGFMQIPDNIVDSPFG